MADDTDAARSPRVPPQNQIRVLIADDHAVVRHGLRLFLDLQEDLEVIAEAENGREAIQMAGAMLPDVILMDLVMPVVDGIEATVAVRELSPRPKVVVLTTFVDDERVVRCLRAGASAYLLKDVSPDALAQAIRMVHRGDPVLHPEAVRYVVRRLAGDAGIPEGTVTLLFTDIVDSTATVRELGDETSRALFRQHDRVLRDALKAHRGLEVKHQGDGLMVAFSSSRWALRCAIQMQRALSDLGSGGVRVRIGLHTGEVVAEEADYFGEAVCMASRVRDVAAGGEILVSELTRALAGTRYASFTDRGEHELKGIPGPHRLYAVEWSAGN